MGLCYNLKAVLVLAHCTGTLMYIYRIITIFTMHDEGEHNVLRSTFYKVIFAVLKI